MSVSALEDYLSRPSASPDPAALDAIADPMPAREALPRENVDQLLDPDRSMRECGWCRLDDGSGYVAMRTEMPGVSGEMVDWWFDWHPRDSLRYRIWHPLAHESNSLEPALVPGRKPYWGTVHHPVEDIGTGTVHARIEFMPPQLLGFSAGVLDRPEVAAIVGGFAGDDKRHARHTKMVHVFLNDDTGVFLRSRFWIGSELRPYAPAPLAAIGAFVINRPFVRRRLVADAVPRALARHCAEEYANLASILPELYEAHGSST